MLGASAAACCLLIYTSGGRTARRTENAEETQSDGLQRVVHPYSVVPGGIRTPEELSAAAAQDPVVAAHYRGIRHGMAGGELPRDIKAHVSYRVGERVYWTRRPVLLKKGEPVLANGAERVRQRCGNRISEVPREPVRAHDPPESTWDEVESAMENGLRSMPSAIEPLLVPPSPPAPKTAAGGLTFSNLPLSAAAQVEKIDWPAPGFGGMAFAPDAGAHAPGLPPGPETGSLPVPPIEPPPDLFLPPEVREASMPPWKPPPAIVAPPFELIPPAVGFPALLSKSATDLPGRKTPPPSGSTPPQVPTPIVVGTVSHPIPPAATGNNFPGFLPPGDTPEQFQQTGDSADIPEPAAVLLTAAALCWMLRRAGAGRSTGGN